MSESTPIWFDSHMHTPLCKHATGHPRDYVAHGVQQGLKGIIFTCHSPMPNRWSHSVRMAPDQLDDYIQLVAEGRNSAPPDFEVLLGMESDFFPGMEDWLEKLHQRADFHFILGSVHWHIPEYRDAYWHGDIDEFYCTYFQHLAESAETGLYDCLAHPDLIKNADPEYWDPQSVEQIIGASLDRVAASGVAMELNTSGVNKLYPEMNPGLFVLQMMAARDIPVVVGSDAHHPLRVGDLFNEALDLLEQAGYQEVQTFKERKPSPIPLDMARASLLAPNFQFV